MTHYELAYMHTMSQRICMRHTTFHYMYNYIRIRGGTQGAREEGVGRKGGQKARENESVCVGGILFRLLTLRITYDSNSSPQTGSSCCRRCCNKREEGDEWS